MKIGISLPEVMEFCKEIQEQAKQIFEIIRGEIRSNVGQYLSNLMELELTHFLGRDRYERSSGAVNYRNGSYERRFALKGIGEVQVKVPRDREGAFKSKVLPRSKRYEEEIREDLSFMFLTGISTRSLSMLSKRLIGRISNANKELIDAVERWRVRDLSKEPIKYLFVDGVNFDMRIDGSIEKVPALIAIGLTEEGHKRVL